MEYDICSDESVAQAIIRAVSDFENRSKTSIPPLQETIDVDAVNAIFDHSSGAEPHLKFYYSDNHISVHGGDSLTVRSDVADKLRE